MFHRDSSFHTELLLKVRNTANSISVAPKTDLPKIGSHIPMGWSQKERRDTGFKCTCAKTYLVDLIFLQLSVEID